LYAPGPSIYSTSMPSLKIYPPSKLPEKGVTDLLFDVWSQELQVYIQQDERLAVFLPRGAYNQWEALDVNPDRITEVRGEDAAAQLPVRRRELSAFLSIVAKSCDLQHYNLVTRHSTSLEWIFKRLREDYDIQQKGIHFFNILDLKYQPGEPASGFYNKYRNMVSANLGKRGDIIAWQANAELEADEKLSPTFEDMILANVLALIDARLPAHIKDHYHHLIGKTKRLMDFKADILVKVPTFLLEIENKPQNSTIHCQPEEHLGAMRYQPTYRPRPQPFRGGFATQRGRRGFHTDHGTTRQYQTTSTNRFPLYCRLCHLTGQPEEMVRSHRLGDLSCPKISATDKQLIEASRAQPRVNAIQQAPDTPYTNELADMLGYGEEDPVDNLPEDQVSQDHAHTDQQYRQPSGPKSSHFLSRVTEQKNIPNSTFLPRNTTVPCTSDAAAKPQPPRCNFIKPVSSQILTVFTQDKQPLHIELDSNATVNYIRLDTAKAFNFSISPNSQLSILADGITKLPAVGEINETFFRNDWQVQFRAVVVKNLHTQLIGGTVFLQANSIQQDFNRNTIHIANKYTVPSTSAAMLLPIQPYSHLCNLNTTKTLLPGQSIKITVPFPDNDVVAVEPADSSSIDAWPQPQLCTISGGAVNLQNSTTAPILLGKDIKQLHIRPTMLLQPQTQPCSNFQNSHYHTPELPAIPTDARVPSTVVTTINNAQAQHKQVFNKDLSEGYNGASGPHVCKLNWAGATRPTADQVRMVSYSHDLKQLHQAVCDDLTNQQVLGIPQDHDITVQFVCPSFLRRKPKAKGKPNHLLTKDDVRLVVNFSPVNDHLKNIPSVKTTPNDILVSLGRWKCIIIFDLYQGFFQNHMHQQDCKWLGVATPFGGIRFLRRSGQGLLGQSEELEELLTKILKPELETGNCCKIADDIIIGGQTYQETADIYATVLHKLAAANIKLAANKTHIFPKTADILGWKWEEGGRLLPSPHRQLALKNTKQDDISTIKDLRSWIGLYKTLLIATPNLANIMDPFDQETANKESREKVTWTTELACAFRDAKNHIDTIRELYLPAPEDQLLLVPDGSQKTPGIGHVLYALVDGHRKPVRYHSVKLPDHCKKWSPCEIEALAFATGIQAEIDIIKESKHPLLIAPDSSPVKDAVNLIKKGKFSASARMNSFITNINRIPVEVLHVSGKANLNAVSDMQSRNPSSCGTQPCTICNFVQTSINSVLSPNASLGAISTHNLYNTKSWAATQQANTACKTAASHLRTGKQPSKKSGQIYSEIRRYCTIAKLGPNGCLVVPPSPTMGDHQLEKIVIPTPLLPSLLWHMHNSENHPAKTQLRAKFDKMFYGIMVQQQLDSIYEECFQCKIQAHLPKTAPTHTTCAKVEHPGHYFHADVIRREKQKILIITDQFSTLSTANLIPSEQQQDLKTAIINLTSPVRLSPSITIRTDNATGFQALLKDIELQDLGIKIELADPHNPNANAVVDKACRELEQEINKLQPQGGQITAATLAKATLLLNAKLRRKDKLSATEIHFARNQATSANLMLDDSEIRKSQISNRHTTVVTPANNNIKEGDTVMLAANPPKHTTRDLFLVTATENQKVSMQKITHPFSTNSTLRPKTYTTNQQLLKPVHQPRQTYQAMIEPEVYQQQPQPSTWSPIPQDYYTQQDSQDEEDDDNAIPTPLQRMAQWMQQQRQRTAQARENNQNAIQAFIPPPRPPPPAQPTVVVTPATPIAQKRAQQPSPPPLPPPQSPQPQQRQAKLKAIQALTSNNPSSSATIPQLEGAEPTPETTPDNSYDEPQQHHLSPQEPWSPSHPHGQHHILNTAFLLDHNHGSQQSMQWDDQWDEPYYMNTSTASNSSLHWEEDHDDLLFASPHPAEIPDNLFSLQPHSRRHTH